MRAVRQETIDFSHSADAVFQAALGVQQSTKNIAILAVHNEGRKLVVREKSMMSNRKFHQILVEQKKTEVPWTDPNADPQIEFDGNFVATAYGL